MPENGKSSGKAIASLVLGLSGFCLSLIAGIPALILGVLALREISASQGQVGGRGMAITGIATGAISTFVCPIVLVALLLPAVMSAREAARRMQCSGNMHYISFALHNYHSAIGTLPPPFIADDTGNRIHSWRGLIAPYMDLQEVRNYSLDEPWNGPNNVALAESEVSVFTCPSDADGDANRTSYVAVVGPGFAFDETAAVTFSSITDGAADTILLVEVAGRDIQWAEPRDLTFEEFLALYNDQAVSHHPGGFNVAYADASVHFLHYGLAPAELRALFTRDGGEPINFER